jgi:predicted ester cyclase
MTGTAARNITIMTDAFDALNRRDLDACVAMMTPDFQIHVAGSPFRQGIAAWRGNVGIMFKAFPDARVHVDDIFASDDKVAVRIRITGTHTGDFLGKSPTNRAISYDSNELYRITDGKISAEWICSDSLTMMAQIGIYSKGAMLGVWLASYKVWIAAAIGFVAGAAAFAMV